MRDIITEAYQQAVAVLKGNITPLGFRASRHRYNAIWGRDGSITVLGAILTVDEELLQAGIKTLATLAENRTALGQIPNNVPLNGNRANFYSSDATGWWVIAVAGLWQATRDRSVLERFWPWVREAMTWLRYQVVDCTGLMNSAPASDWMDSSIQRWGKVFYTNLVYLRALHCANQMAQDLGEAGLDDSVPLRYAINRVFWPEEDSIGEWLGGWNDDFYREATDPHRRHYLNFLTFESYDHRCDVLANCLAVLWDVADQERSQRVLGYIADKNLANPFPVRVLDPAILVPDPSWNPAIDLHRPIYWQNRPYCYHNEAIWPWVGGFYVAALAKAGHSAEARKALEGLAQANRAGKEGEWEFNEWLHGQTGEPMGAAYQSWSAAGYILAYKAVVEGVLP